MRVTAHARARYRERVEAGVPSPTIDARLNRIVTNGRRLRRSPRWARAGKWGSAENFTASHDGRRAKRMPYTNREYGVVWHEDPDLLVIVKDDTIATVIPKGTDPFY